MHIINEKCKYLREFNWVINSKVDLRSICKCNERIRVFPEKKKTFIFSALCKNKA